MGWNQIQTVAIVRKTTKGKILIKVLKPKRSLFQAFVDTTTAKLTTYCDITPHATTLSKLRKGKTKYNENAGRGSRQVGGSAKVLSRKVLNKGLKQLELAQPLKAACEKPAAECKLATEQRKQAKQVREQQWRFDLDAYEDQVTAWRDQVASLEGTTRSGPNGP